VANRAAAEDGSTDDLSRSHGRSLQVAVEDLLTFIGACVQY